MREMTLQKYLSEGRTQGEVAAALGCTQGAIWQMLRDERDIRVVLQDDGSITAHEIKPVGKNSAA